MQRLALIFAAFLLLGALALGSEGFIGPLAVMTGFVVVLHVRPR